MARKIVLGFGGLVFGIGAALLAGFLIEPLERPVDWVESSLPERTVSAGPFRVRLETQDSEPGRERIPPQAALREGPEEAAARMAQGAGPAFRVKVLTEAGGPIPGAGVRLFRRPAGTPLDEDTTRETGEAELAVPRPGDEIEARARGFETRRIALRTDSWPVPYSIVLRKGKVFLEGYVVNDHQLPVAGAHVHLVLADRTFPAETGPDGTFDFSALDPPAFPLQGSFSVAHPLHCFLGEGRETAVPGNSAPVTLVVHRWARLRVVVRDAGGRIPERVRLKLAGMPGVPDRFQLPGAPAHEGVRVRRLIPGEGAGLTANALEPCFLIDTVPPLLPLWLVAEHPAYRPVEKELGIFEPGGEREIAVRLDNSLERLEMVFEIRDPQGEPLFGVEACCRWSPHEGKASQQRIEVEAGGVLRLVPPSQRWNLLVTAPGYAPLRRRFDAYPERRGRITLTLHPAESEILVCVHDAAGQPVPDLRVTLEDQRLGNMDYWKNLEDWSLAAGFIHKTGSTDGEGKARFSGLDPEERYVVNLGLGVPGRYLQGGSGDRRDVPSPASFSGVGCSDSPLRFRLVPPAALQGRICGEGLEGVAVFLSCFDGLQAGERPLFTVNSILGPDGAFFFDGLPSGRYHLYVPDLAHGNDFNSPLAVFTLGEGERLSCVEVRPPR